MKIALQPGDKIKLLPTPQLLELFEQRQFFSGVFRQEAAEKLGGKEGIVTSIEEKYQFDYFGFSKFGETITWSIPYQAVDFEAQPGNEKASTSAQRVQRVIYLIERIWIDNMENQTASAVGYETYGFVDTEDEAKIFCEKGRVFTEDDSWAISGQVKEYKYSPVKHCC